MPAINSSLRPAEFCRQYLHTLDASEGRRKQRKRDTTPDALGINLKRELLQAALDDDPDPSAFEAWLLARTLSATAGGPLRAMCVEVLADYRFATLDPGFSQWLTSGARSADAGDLPTASSV